MIAVLTQPSFWPEPKDPWSWQRALAELASLPCIPDPRPCWEEVLRARLPRRSIPGLYGIRQYPKPGIVLGAGLLQHNAEGWVITDEARELIALDREAFKFRLAELLIRRSAWLRLSLLNCVSGHWSLPHGSKPLKVQRRMRIGKDLLIAEGNLHKLPPPRTLLGGLFTPEISEVRSTVRPAALCALHSPLYLLYALGWLTDTGEVRLPDSISTALFPESSAARLRRITSEEQDVAGFVSLAKVAHRLWSELDSGAKPKSIAAWTDITIGQAIETGTIEVLAWAPGQPRHGRGLYGDRDRKLVKWVIHDDFIVRQESGGEPE